MKKRKNYGRKIKRKRTNLYRRRKTKGQKIFGTVMLIILICAIGFLGYCLGKPLLDFFGRQTSSEPPEWTPPETVAAEITLPETSAEETKAPVTSAPAIETETTVTEITTAEKPLEYTNLIVSAAPSGALSNRAALSAELAKAKASGFNAVMIQLKDEKGFFHYKTAIEGAEENELIKGEMSLAEIVSVFKESGIVPVAEISVLTDNEGCKAFPEMSYKCKGENVSWLDYKQGTPVRWANPESERTAEYFKAVTEEINAAGINEILCRNIVFPNFEYYDAEYIDSRYFENDRYRYLSDFLTEGTVLEMSAADIIAEEFGRTAEPLYDPSIISNRAIALVIDREDFPVSEGYPADIRNLAESVISLASAKTGDIPLIPVIERGALSEAEAKTAAETLKSLGYSDFIIR